MALSIFSLIGLTVYSIFSSALKVNNRFQRADHLYRGVQGSLNVMAQDLANIVSYQYRTEEAQRLTFFGGPGSMTFVRATKEGLQVVRYSLNPRESGLIRKTIVNRRPFKPSSIRGYFKEEFERRELLVREEIPLSDYLRFNLGGDSPADQGWVESQPTFLKEILSRDIQKGGLRFWYAYRKQIEDRSQMVWQEDWDKDYLPLGIRVEMIFLDPREGGGPLHFSTDVWIPATAWGIIEEEL